MNAKNKSRGILILNNRYPTDGVGRYASSLFSALRGLSSINIEFLSWHRKLFRGTDKKLAKLLPYFAFESFMENRIPKEYALYHVTNQGLMSNVLGKVFPSVITVHDLIPLTVPRDLRDLIVKKIMINKLPQANAVICISEATKQELLKLTSIEPETIRVVHHGVDHALFRPREKVFARRRLGLPVDKKIILHVGSEESRKNVPILLEAFSNLRKEFPKVVLIRIGERSKSTIRLIKTRGLENSILHLRGISDKRLALFYNAADLFVFPSYYEGFGMPALEAMSSGVPVISTNVSATAEVVGDGGVLINPFDVEAFTCWMNKVITDPILQERLGKNAFRRSAMFDWAKCAKDTLHVYENVLVD